MEERELGSMKIQYCKKYEKYVSQQHCEFFNQGKDCDFYTPVSWNSIKDLLRDENRPKWEVNAVIKPFKCDLLDREYLNRLNRRRRSRRFDRPVARDQRS
ncbi:MAG: hypothetical protein KBH99_04635 [Syntrophobacteraceae bacterium]|nr:hypothetical protein [Syntrophobacteraceae bacterium]